jgi:ClpA/ClpB-like protein
MTPTNLTFEDLVKTIVRQVPDGALDQLAEAVRTADELDALGDHLIGYFVDRARISGASWTQIGTQLGVSKQAAQQRYVPKAPQQAEDGALGPASFARYTRRARDVVMAARQIAIEHRHERIGTEHLLAGLCQDPDGLAYKVLDTLAGPASRVEQLAAAAMPEPGAEPVRNPGTTKALRVVMKLTLDAALELGHNYVGTEHLLLALANTEGRDDAGGGARVLAELGVTGETVRAAVVEAVEEFLRQRETLAELTAKDRDK